jgi:hypothetical protein
MTAPADEQKVTLIVNTDRWLAMNRDAGIRTTHAHNGHPALVGSAQKLALLILAAVHHIGVGDAHLLAAIVRTGPRVLDEHIYYFPGLELL